MIKILGRSTSGNVQKALFLLEEIGKPFEREDYGRLFSNTDTEEYKALNPTSKVPTMLDGDVVVWESNSILRYLAETQAPGFLGANASENSQINRWLDFLLASINSGYMAAFKGSKQSAEERPPEYAGLVADLAANMALIDAHLAGKDFFALGKLTLADIAMAPIMRRCIDFDIGQGELPNLNRWMDAMTARPAFLKATDYSPPNTAA